MTKVQKLKKNKKIFANWFSISKNIKALSKEIDELKLQLYNEIKNNQTIIDNAINLLIELKGYCTVDKNYFTFNNVPITYGIEIVIYYILGYSSEDIIEYLNHDEYRINLLYYSGEYFFNNLLQMNELDS